MSLLSRLLLAAPLLAGPACARAEAAPSPPTTASAAPLVVDTAAATEASFPRTILLSGSVVAHQRVELAADTAGKVLETRVERGARVEKGAVLARIDTRDGALSAAEATAALRAARTQERLARLECDRAERLLDHEVISRAERDRLQAACDSSAAATKAAAARAARAGKLVTDGVLRAPFAGVIAERGVSAGDFVVPGRPIVVLVQRDPLRLELAVPEAAVAQVAEGQSLGFSVAPLPDARFVARVRWVGPSLDPRTRNLTIEAVVDGGDARLLPGMFATARLSVGEQRLVAVPASSITRRGETARVFVVAEGQIRERVVQLGESDGERVAVTKGVRAGERVVVRPTASVADGARVN
ncbi:MAG: efflux RND transporter periplasmic adaptor subunit [Polyangiaceae bacterium]|nr:efflux RND transporter periplasmic adaptor subunit [Polyangiaceae bacterium]